MNLNKWTLIALILLSPTAFANSVKINNKSTCETAFQEKVKLLLNHNAIRPFVAKMVEHMTNLSETESKAVDRLMKRHDGTLDELIADSKLHQKSRFFLKNLSYQVRSTPDNAIAETSYDSESEVPEVRVLLKSGLQDELKDVHAINISYSLFDLGQPNFIDVTFLIDTSYWRANKRRQVLGQTIQAGHSRSKHIISLADAAMTLAQEECSGTSAKQKTQMIQSKNLFNRMGPTEFAQTIQSSAAPLERTALNQAK